MERIVPDAIYLSMARKGHDDYHMFLNLSSSLFLNGVGLSNYQIRSLSVSTSRPSASLFSPPLVTWDHSVKWRVPTSKAQTCDLFEIVRQCAWSSTCSWKSFNILRNIVSMDDCLASYSLSILLSGSGSMRIIGYSNVCRSKAQFSAVRFHSATILTMETATFLYIDISRASGHFEIRNSATDLVVSRSVHVSVAMSKEDLQLRMDEDSNGEVKQQQHQQQQQQDNNDEQHHPHQALYDHLRQFGYHFQGRFKSLWTINFEHNPRV